MNPSDCWLLICCSVWCSCLPLCCGVCLFFFNSHSVKHRTAKPFQWPTSRSTLRRPHHQWPPHGVPKLWDHRLRLLLLRAVPGWVWVIQRLRLLYQGQTDILRPVYRRCDYDCWCTLGNDVGVIGAGANASVFKRLGRRFLLLRSKRQGQKYCRRI